MDYLGWELERQRSALAALLLGVSEARDSVQGDARRKNGGAPELYSRSGQQALGAWEVVRAAGQDREGVGIETVETPVSAWEALLGGEDVWAVRQDREVGGAGTMGTPVSAWESILGGEAGAPIRSRGESWPRLGGGTGARPEFARPSGGYTARRGMRRTEAGLAAETQGLTAEIQDLPAGGGGDGAGDGAAPPETGASRNRAAGNNAAAGYPERFRRVDRGRGNTTDALGLNGPSAGTAPWGGWGTAALRAEDSAKALSRAVQRDARRYDGGFNIY